MTSRDPPYQQPQQSSQPLIMAPPPGLVGMGLPPPSSYMVLSIFICIRFVILIYHVNVSYVLTRLEEAPFLYFLWTLLFSLLYFVPSTYGQSQNSYSVNTQYQAISQPQHMPQVHSGTQQRGSANQNSVLTSQGM